MSQIAITPAAAATAPKIGQLQADHQAERPLKPAMWKGWQRRCPACGEGRLLSGFLKVVDHCEHCGEDYTAQRADDGPAYITILVVGKTVITLYLLVYLAFEFSPAVMIALTWAVALGMSAWLLPRTKGAMVAFQWAKRMHGFAPADARVIEDAEIEAPSSLA